MDIGALCERAPDRRSDEKERRSTNGLATVPAPPPLEKS